MKKSYAQCGEDLIINYLIAGVLKLNNTDPYYFDIGGYDPHKFSNTFLFYSTNRQGIVVEPSKVAADRFQEIRERDIVHQAAVGELSGEQILFHMSADTLNTINQEEAQRMAAKGYPVRRQEKVRVLTMNSLFEQHGLPIFVSVDVEGHEMAVLDGWDMGKWRPPVLCFETLDFVSQTKVKPLIDRILAQGYQIYADTFLNTIFWLGKKT